MNDLEKMRLRIQQMAEDGEISGQVAFYLLSGEWPEPDTENGKPKCLGCPPEDCPVRADGVCEHLIECRRVWSCSDKGKTEEKPSTYVVRSKGDHIKVCGNEDDCDGGVICFKGTGCIYKEQDVNYCWCFTCTRRKCHPPQEVEL